MFFHTFIAIRHGIASFSSNHHQTAVVIVHPGSVAPAAVPQAWPAVGWLALLIVWAAGAAFVVTRAVLAQRATSGAARVAPPASADAHALLVELAARVSVRVPRLVIGDPFAVVDAAIERDVDAEAEETHESESIAQGLGLGAWGLAWDLGLELEP